MIIYHRLLTSCARSGGGRTTTMMRWCDVTDETMLNPTMIRRTDEVCWLPLGDPGFLWQVTWSFANLDKRSTWLRSLWLRGLDEQPPCRQIEFQSRCVSSLEFSEGSKAYQWIMRLCLMVRLAAGLRGIEKWSPAQTHKIDTFCAFKEYRLDDWMFFWC